MRRMRLALVVVLAAALSALPAYVALAADVALVVNVEGPVSGLTTDTIDYALSVQNRSGQDAANPATITFSAPNAASGGGVAVSDWTSGISCTSSGAASCPSGPFTLSADASTVNITAPPLGSGGALDFRIKVPGNPSNGVVGSVVITASATVSSGDTNTTPQTSSASSTIVLRSPGVRYAVAATGPASATVGDVFSYQVVLSNTGEVTNDLAARTKIVNTNLSGGFQSVSCSDETGGADCANLRAIQIIGGKARLVSPQPTPLVASGSSLGYVGVLDMPAGSSVTLTYTVTETASCPTSAATTGIANLQVTVSNITPFGLAETSDSVSNNTASVATNLPIPCRNGDLATSALTQPSSQSNNGIDPNSAWSFTATYANLGTSDSASSAITTTFDGWDWTATSGDPRRDQWAVGVRASTSPSCTASGGATCPSSWDLQHSGGPLTLVGAGASLPAGGSLVITYSGQGGDYPDPASCRYGVFTMSTWVLDGQLSEADASKTLTTRNNYKTTSARSNTAIADPECVNYDVVAGQTGPFLDSALTQPVTGAIRPGQTIYYRSSITNADPGRELETWMISSSADRPAITTFAGKDPFENQNGTYQQFTWGTGGLVDRWGTPSSVDCVTGGALCPSALTAVDEVGGWVSWRYSPDAIDPYTQPWTANAGTDPALPVSSSLEFVTAATAPLLADDAPCLTSTYGGGASVLWTLSTGVSGLTDQPAAAERDTTNNRASTDLTIQIPECSGSPLAISKRAVTAMLGRDHVAKYKVTVTNPGPVALDLPRLVETFAPDAPATVECIGTTGGGLCPVFVPEQGTRYGADGSQTPISASGDGAAQFDFVWGELGKDTMPAGSTVTFAVTVDYPASYIGAATNTATFSGDPASTRATWPSVSDTATVSAASGHSFAVRKSVSPTQPRPGQTVTFTLDLINVGVDSAPAYFNDALTSTLAVANPLGFTDLSCRPITEADQILDPLRSVATTSCPDFTSTSSGLTAEIQSFAANSGLHLTYQAIAPATASGAPNTAELVNDLNQATIGDAVAQANFAVLTTQVSGTVWNDANDSAKDTFANIKSTGEKGTDATGLSAVLIDAQTGTVIGVVPIAPDGSYMFTDVPCDLDVTVLITEPAATPAVGDRPTQPQLPAGWANTTPLQQASFNTGTKPIEHKDFGIQRPPNTDDKTEPSRRNPGQVQVQVPSLTGLDPEDGLKGAKDTFRIVTLPDPAAGVLWYAGKRVVAGQVITDYDPAKLTVIPGPGNVAIEFTVAAIDAAGSEDATPATVRMPFYVLAADLAVTKRVVAGACAPHQSITYQVSVRNDGPGAATNIVVTDRLPAGAKLVSTTASGGRFTVANNEWTLDNLPSGRTETALIVMTSPSQLGGSLTNFAQVTSADEPDLDSTPDNLGTSAAEDDEAAATLTCATTPLAYTGVAAGPLLWAAIALIAGGAVLLGFRSRRAH